MTEYSRYAKGSYTLAATGNTQVVYLPFQPSVVKLYNETAYAGFSASTIPWAVWDAGSQAQGTAIVGYVASGPVLQTGQVLTQGISTFAAGLALQYGPQQQIIGATAANPIVVNVTAHGYSVGDVVILEGLFQSATTGMPQIAGIPFSISAVGDANHFSIVWPGAGSNYTALSGSPSGAYVRKVLYPYLYLPGVNFIEAITTGSTTTVVTTTNHNYVVGQEIAFRIPTVWGTTQLNSLPNNLIPGSPMYGFVTSITNNTTFVCNINSTGYTAFNTNQPVASVSGQQFPQVVAVGDVNTGGVQYTGGSNYYPSPAFPTSSGGISTINGPAIQGAFVNNTRQGFSVGPGNAKVGAAGADTSSHLSGTTSDVVLWEAFIPDLSMP
jgi:hypothetical protein